MKRLCRRSWGWWFVLLDRKHFKVKLLRFHDQGRLSKQYHNLRGELWLFLSGYGRFWRGGKEDDYGYFEAKCGDSILVERKYLHRYEAFKTTWVLEVQYGDECKESDIVRI